MTSASIQTRPQSRAQAAWKRLETSGNVVAFTPKSGKGGKYPFALSGIVFGQNPNNPTFVKLHLAQTGANFRKLMETGKVNPNLPDGYYIDEVRGANPNTLAEMFLEKLASVGGPYGWSHRKKYQEPHKGDLLAKMADPETRLFRFFVEERLVGFCLLAGIKPTWDKRQHEQGLDKMSAVNRFAKQEALGDWPHPVEIYKIGMLPDDVGHGYGQVFLDELTRQIFEEGKYNIIYLDTRDTNPKGTEEFYAGRGYRVFCAQTLQNDLAYPVRWPPTLTPAAQALADRLADPKPAYTPA